MPETIYSDDYTRLVLFRSRQWTAGDVSMAWCGGLSFDIAIAALRSSVIPAAVLLVVLLLAGGSWPLLMALLGPIVYVISYSWQAHRDPDRTPLNGAKAGNAALRGIGPTKRRRLRRAYRAQPKNLLGFGHNLEPTEIHWQVILFSPTDIAEDS